MVDLYGRGKSGVTLTPQVDADFHQKSSILITSLDDLRGKSVNSLMNRRTFFLLWLLIKCWKLSLPKKTRRFENIVANTFMLYFVHMSRDRCNNVEIVIC